MIQSIAVQTTNPRVFSTIMRNVKTVSKHHLLDCLRVHIFKKYVSRVTFKGFKDED